jgi:hypothetical protein
MHTIKQIIDNQKKFKEQIISFLNSEHAAARKELQKIDTKDEFILNAKKKLEAKFKQVKIKGHLDKLFFMHSSRNEEFYAWWDDSQNEVIILSYDKK